jgi:hypothetical protein
MYITCAAIPGPNQPQGAMKPRGYERHLNWHRLDRAGTATRQGMIRQS